MGQQQSKLTLATHLNLPTGYLVNFQHLYSHLQTNVQTMVFDSTTGISACAA